MQALPFWWIVILGSGYSSLFLIYWGDASYWGHSTGEAWSSWKWVEMPWTRECRSAWGERECYQNWQILWGLETACMITESWDERPRSNYLPDMGCIYGQGYFASTQKESLLPVEEIKYFSIIFLGNNMDYWGNSGEKLSMYTFQKSVFQSDWQWRQLLYRVYVY